MSTHAMTLRLDAGDLRTLDDLCENRGGCSRSDAIRTLIRESTQTHMAGIITEAIAEEARDVVREGIRDMFHRRR